MATHGNDATPDDQVRKRLFGFCDGTWKDGVNHQRPLTNVATLARCLQGVADDGYLQMIYYDSGVCNAASRPAQVIDGATGREMPTVSSRTTTTSKGDEIFLVGFSRGAFAVQCLASFIGETGLFQKQHLYYLRELFALWKNQSIKRIGSKRKSVEEDKLLHRVKIKACAVWDTVSALGLPTPWPRPLSFVGQRIPAVIENSFHALALDEVRSQFEPCIWQSKESSETFARQCWFLSSHPDVGGNGDAALGAVTLIWIIGRLQAYTNATFDMPEIKKHLKHKFLEWNVHINGLLGQFKDTAIYSGLSSSGRRTSPSYFWSLSGTKPRGAHLHFQHDDADLSLVHFTVRFLMSEDLTMCKALRKWKTDIQPDGAVQWKLKERVLFEATLSENTESREYKEYELFREWRDIDPPLLSDRRTFTAHARGLIRDKAEERDEHLK
ncbi:hypothetical protein GGR54DRAFT_628115 [Hypoxylon sp. NC1633]|nr:hypothetical protein GGR54DRAFT_628115 [Hypoxylon sp. NC1633]